MRGLINGIMTVYKRESTLLEVDDFPRVGTTYVQRRVTKYIDTTVRWELQVEKAFCLPVTVGILKIVKTI